MKMCVCMLSAMPISYHESQFVANNIIMSIVDPKKSYFNNKQNYNRDLAIQSCTMRVTGLLGVQYSIIICCTTGM